MSEPMVNVELFLGKCLIKLDMDNQRRVELQGRAETARKQEVARLWGEVWAAVDAMVPEEIRGFVDVDNTKMLEDEPGMRVTLMARIPTCAPVLFQLDLVADGQWELAETGRGMGFKIPFPVLRDSPYRHAHLDWEWHGYNVAWSNELEIAVGMAYQRGHQAAMMLADVHRANERHELERELVDSPVYVTDEEEEEDEQL